MLGIEFLVRGALEFNEPGVLMAFEETPRDMASNVASLAAKKKLFLDYISVDPSEIAETGQCRQPRGPGIKKGEARPGVTAKAGKNCKLSRSPSTYRIYLMSKAVN
jgi:circadian clock protein KaiC